MKNRRLHLSILLLFCWGVVSAQNNEHKNEMSDTQKAQAAKADVYIINSKKKITDSLTTKTDTTAATKKSKKKCTPKEIKKAPERGALYK
jgi:hypothetical protein